MAFSQKTWTKRLSEYPTRRQLTYTDGTTAIVDVARSEGTVSAEGDAFSDTNMNDLEQRIADAFDECFQSVSDGKALVASAITDKGVTTASDATFETMADNIASLSSGGNIVAVMHQATVAKSGTMSNCKFSNSDFVSVSSGVFTVKKAGTYHFDAMGLNNYCQLLVNSASVQTWGSGTIATTSKALAVGDKFYFKNNNTSYTNNMLAVVWVE